MKVGSAVEVAVSELEQAPSRRVRVLLDARKLGDGGIGTYVENLIFGLLDVGECDLTLIVKSPDQVLEPWKGQIEIVVDAASPYSVDEYVGLMRRIDQSRYDVFHEPHYTLPFGVKIPSVVTLHDLIHIQNPEGFYYPFVAKPLIRSAVKRATRVLAVSRSTRNELSHLVGKNDAVLEKVKVIPNAICPLFTSEGRTFVNIEQRFGIEGDYLLAIFSTLKPHKGLEELLTAFQDIKLHRMQNGEKHLFSQDVRNVKLVLVGQGTAGLAENSTLLEKVSSTPDVHILGTVSKEDLSGLYRGALALVVSSVAEGFCLPMLEAQATGTPVIGRPVPSLLELRTEKDRIATDFSAQAFEEEIAQFLLGVSREDTKHEKIVLKPHLARFDRKELARQVMDVYEDAAKIRKS